MGNACMPQARRDVLSWGAEGYREDQVRSLQGGEGPTGTPAAECVCLHQCMLGVRHFVLAAWQAVDILIFKGREELEVRPTASMVPPFHVFPACISAQIITCSHNHLADVPDDAQTTAPRHHRIPGALFRPGQERQEAQRPHALPGDIHRDGKPPNPQKVRAGFVYEGVDEPCRSVAHHRLTVRDAVGRVRQLGLGHVHYTALLYYTGIGFYILCVAT